jgi:hypothetical protein
MLPVPFFCNIENWVLGQINNDEKNARSYQHMVLCKFPSRLNLGVVVIILDIFSGRVNPYDSLNKHYAYKNHVI